MFFRAGCLYTHFLNLSIPITPCEATIVLHLQNTVKNRKVSMLFEICSQTILHRRAPTNKTTVWYLFIAHNGLPRLYENKSFTLRRQTSRKQFFEPIKKFKKFFKFDTMWNISSFVTKNPLRGDLVHIRRIRDKPPLNTYQNEIFRFGMSAQVDIALDNWSIKNFLLFQSFTPDSQPRLEWICRYS